MKINSLFLIGISLLTFLLLVSCDVLSSDPNAIVVTFDASSCTVSGPSELAPGEHTFNFIDESDWEGELWLT